VPNIPSSVARTASYALNNVVLSYVEEVGEKGSEAFRENPTLRRGVYLFEGSCTHKGLAGLLGWDPDAPNQRARLAPQLPPSWHRMSARNLKIGASSLDVDVQQGPGYLTIDIVATGTPVMVDFVLPIPLGARDVGFTVSPVEGPGHGSTRNGRHDGQYLISIPVSDRQTRLELTWHGGLILDPPTAKLDPGQESHGIRVLDFQESARGWRLVVEGNSGGSYQVDLHGEAVRVGSGPARVAYQEGVNRLTITFPPGGQRRTAAIGLEPLQP